MLRSGFSFLPSGIPSFGVLEFGLVFCKRSDCAPCVEACRGRLQGDFFHTHACHAGLGSCHRGADAVAISALVPAHHGFHTVGVDEQVHGPPEH